MNRSRLLPIVSAVLGSTSAFVVLTRWGLLGTLTGAVMFPVVYTLASNGSKAGMERISKWTQAKMQNGEVAAEAEQSEPSEAKQAAPAEQSEPFQDTQVAPSNSAQESSEEEQPVVAPTRNPRKIWARTWRRMRVQWPVTVVAVIALGVSVYALTQADFTGEVIIKETVVEKTVTVTSEVPRTSVVYITTPATDGASDQTTTTVADGEEDPGTTETTLPGDDSTSTTEPTTTSTTLP